VFSALNALPNPSEPDFTARGAASGRTEHRGSCQRRRHLDRGPARRGVRAARSCWRRGGDRDTNRAAGDEL